MTTSRDRLGRDEAARRAEQVSGVQYTLHIDLAAGEKEFGGEATIQFDHSGGDTFLEWMGGRIESFEVNGAESDPEWDGHRISLPASILGSHNRIRVSYRRPYDRTGEGLHHFIDPEDGREYLYTQLEPYSAHRIFPCFDQPDLKATYDLTVTAPSTWEVTGPSSEVEREDVGEGRELRRFATTKPFSTYLMSIVAGEYGSISAGQAPVPMRLLTRASLMPHLERDAASLFDTTTRAMEYFAGLFGEPYPFDKYDQAFVPEFNWGGMENVGNVTYTDTVVFREPPTADRVRRRAEYFTHELAHMWFGDLVTMRWWEDIWLNESFASYAGYLALEALGDHEVWQDFNFRMKAWAYREDQRPTTHRIADSVASTDEVFLNFDGITYGKGAAVLKQLVRASGIEGFSAGLHTYFRRHRFGNANLADFLAALQEGSGLDLVGWAARWLKTPSLNTIGTTLTSTGDTITRLELMQSAPDDHPHLRPHHLDIALVSASGAVTAVPGVIEGVTAVVPEAEGLPVPAFVYPNLGDHAFAKVVLDPGSLEFVTHDMGRLDDALLRQQVWASLYEMTRDAILPAPRYMGLVERLLPDERSLPIVEMVTATLPTVIGRFLPEDGIEEAASRFVATARAAVESVPEGDARVLWARTLVAVAASAPDLVVAAALVDAPPEGLLVDQDMRWSVAVKAIAFGVEGADARLAGERERDPSDRGDRAMAAAGSSRPEAGAKQEAWDRIHGDGHGSLAMRRAAASGFWRRSQAALVEPFVSPFFDDLPDRFVEYEAEEAKAYFATFFPRHRVDEELRGRIAALLAGAEIGPMLRRMLVEEDDDLARALRCRAAAASE